MFEQQILKRITRRKFDDGIQHGKITRSKNLAQ